MFAAVFGVLTAADFGVRGVVGISRVFARILVAGAFIMRVIFVGLSCVIRRSGGCLDRCRIG